MSAALVGGAMSAIGNGGAEPPNARRTAVAVAAASATGTSERAESSNKSSSMASKTAETGLPNVAAMPAAAPAASRARLSFALVRST